MHIILVDFQNDFTQPWGKAYKPRRSHDFVRSVMMPKLAETGTRILTIMSDYRSPRPADRAVLCDPTTPGYLMDIGTNQILPKGVWVKSMNSPIWVRDNGGSSYPPGLPYCNPGKFTDWINYHLSPEEEVILAGLTIDCCVLCTAQELSWRGFLPFILVPAVDAYSGLPEDKAAALKVVSNWAQPVDWDMVRWNVTE